jgi:3',5'-cyclic AMP phosphodiesterase CpdA
MNSPGPGAARIKLIHFSDLHVTAPSESWSPSDWVSKRLTGWLNLNYLGRAHRFEWAEKIIGCLRRDWEDRRPDHAIFSGDASSLGFPEEIARAAELLGVDSANQSPALAVPGNHDYYTRSAAACGAFDRYFSSWLWGERVDDATYPYARRIGAFWMVAVNSCTGNRWPWDSCGSVGSEQLARLQELLERLEPGPRILITHYPLCLADGRPELRFRRLRDVDQLLAVCVRAGICLWLHGHRHTPYHRPACQRVPFPMICSGSTTQTRHWSYAEYSLEPGRLHCMRRVYDLKSDRFADGEKFEIDLPTGSS